MPPSPTEANSTPPKVGPTIWLALLAPTSIDIAALIRSGPTASPIIVRRTGLSVAQPMPLQKAATASCQTASLPANAKSARVSEVNPIDSTTRISAVRRSQRSASAPITAPNKVIGSIRSIVSAATTKGEWVCW